MCKKLATIGMAFAMVALVGTLGTARADWFEFFILELEDPTASDGAEDQVLPWDTTQMDGDSYLFPSDDLGSYSNSAPNFTRPRYYASPDSH
jgi:hypothetical protein